MGKLGPCPSVSWMSRAHFSWSPTESTDSSMIFTLRLSNSDLILARWPSSVVQTGVKSLGCENSTAHELPIQSWKRMRPAVVSASKSGAVSFDNQTVRNVFVIGPDKKIKLIMVYPMTTGRNFDEVLRVIDSLQLTAKHKVATPVNWKQGEDVIIAGSVSDEDAKKQYPKGWKAPKPYIRIVPQPR